MCGITGFLSNNKTSEEEGLRTINRMANSLKHRGPDSIGIFSDTRNNLYLGHTRLSIIDLSSAGNQPFTSASKNYTIIFNGEIYNHKALRKEINNLKNIRWRGTSDTETLTELIDLFGIEESLNKLLGMFAIAIWNHKTETICLVRDRGGEKPLYYGIFDNTLIFGSEIKSIKGHPNFINDHDNLALSYYFKLGYIPAPRTAWKNVKKLRPGCYVYFSTNSLNINNQNIPYWKITNSQSKKYLGYHTGDYLKTLDELLNKSVKSQMLSDVPIGAFLSGGVDSSMIVSLMQRNSNNPINSFSIGFENDNYNEAIYAKSVADYLGTNHTELYVRDQDALSIIPKLVSMFDEPFGDPSSIPTYLVSKLASNSVKVSLSGDGGDELFGGYKRYYNSKFNYLSYVSSAFNNLGLNNVFKNLDLRVINGNGSLNKVKFGLDLIRSSDFNSFYFKSLSHWKEVPSLNSDYSLDSFDLNNNSFDSNDSLKNKTGIDFVTYLPDDILTKVDRTAMSVSLETRVPFLDYELIEFAWNVPSDLKYRNNTSKWLLRQVLYNYVPQTLIDRPKMGFGVPMATWLKGPLKKWAESLINDETLITNSFIDVEKVKLSWNLFLKGDNRLQHPIWLVLIYISWLKEN